MAPVHPTPSDDPIILFDGACNFCSDSVRFVVERDPAGVFRFAALQSEAGQALLERYGMPGDDLRTIVLIDKGRTRTKSSAVLEIAARLRRPWPALTLFRSVPVRVRDGAYDMVARHRYRIFGRDDRCLLPTAELKGRFLDGGFAP